jgi:hypothetical protein
MAGAVLIAIAETISVASSRHCPEVMAISTRRDAPSTSDNDARSRRRYGHVSTFAEGPEARRLIRTQQHPRLFQRSAHFMQQRHRYRVRWMLEPAEFLISFASCR